MKRALICVVAMLAFVLLLTCATAENILGADERISARLADNGIDEECYYDVVNALNEYKSDEHYRRIKQLYINNGYGTDERDSDRQDIDKELLENKIRKEYAKIYSKYEGENSREIIIFGYNLSLAYTLSYETTALAELLNAGDVSSVVNLNEYEHFYNEFVTNPSVDVADEFCLYIIKNNVMDYKRGLRAWNIEDVASDISLQLSFVESFMTVASMSVEAKEWLVLIECFENITESYSDIFMTLEMYPEYKETFLKSDIQSARNAIDSMDQALKDYINAMINRDNKKMEKYEAQLLVWGMYTASITSELDEACKAFE